MNKESKEARIARLKEHQFPKGQSPNPGGRPKGSVSLRRELREALSHRDPKDKEGRIYLQTIARKLVETAAMGSIKATAEIFDQLEGKPLQAITLNATLETMAREERVAQVLDRLAALKGADNHSRVN